jgi:hypothetical protein
MDQKKNKRLVLTSVNQVITLVRNNPQLSEQMTRFAPLKDVPLSTAPKKSCNCGSKQNFTTPDANKQVAENILSSLTTQDFLQIKSILGLNELCYYKRSTEKNQLELICT